MKTLICFCIAGFILIPVLLFSQELTIIPNGLIRNGEHALVTGNYVRVRSGPTLEHRILTKMNKDSVVTVIERGENLEEINKMKNYWYKIKIEKSNVEGWMFGHYLTRKGEMPKETQVENVSTPPQIVLEEIGTIKQGPSLIATGDLNQDGIPEIVFLNKEKEAGHFYLVGYEPATQGYSERYSIRLRNTSINRIEVFNLPELENPLLVANGKNFSYFYTYDGEKNMVL